MTKPLCALAVAVALGVVSLPAQTRPDFSGTWRLDEGRSGSPAHEGFVGPVSRTIRQTPDAIVVEITRAGRKTTLNYPLSDKPATRVRGVMGANRGHWDGDRLITEAFQNIQGQTVTTREVTALDSNSDELVVERVVEVEHGYTIQGAQNYSTVKDVFVRVKP